MNELFATSELADLISKVDREERFSFEDGVRLFQSNDLLAVGYMADKIRRRKSGDIVYFVLGRQRENGLDTQSNAAMIYGHGESIEEKVAELLLLRETQDKKGGFLAFAPSAFQSGNAGLDGSLQTSGATGFDDLKALAVSRIMLDNIAHIKASALQLGLKLAQVSLSFGVDDLDGAVSEAQITPSAAAETVQALTQSQLIDMIRAAARKPVARDNLYNIIEAY